MIINSVNLIELVALVTANDLSGMTDYLVNEILEKVGLFGTRFTMQARFYLDVFSRAGLRIILPNEEEQSYIHEKYMSDLVNGVILPETRARLLAIVDKMKARDGIEGLILGGTELPLILRDEEHNGVPFLDTTRIHVDRIVTELLS